MKLLRRISWVTVLERGALLLGGVLVTVAAGGYDWRIGLGLAGLLLLVAGLPIGRRTT
jgi:hypothetical protein